MEGLLGIQMSLGFKVALEGPANVFSTSSGPQTKSLQDPEG